MNGKNEMIPYHNIEQAIETLYLKGIKIPDALTFSEVGRSISVITSQFVNSEKVNLRLFGYISKLLRLLPFKQKENTAIADLCERAWTLGDNKTIAKTVSKVWSLWYNSIEKCEIKFKKKNVKAVCRYDNWNAKYQNEEFSSILKFTKIIRTELSPFLLDAQIHGSLSDMQKTAYSDLDVLLIIKEAVVIDPNALLEFRENALGLLKCIREFDSLQHHGLFILTELEMSCYAESRFPILLMDYATSLIDKPILYFNTIDDKMQSAAALYNMAKRINSIDKISSENYNLKMYSSWIMLLPTMYYQLYNDYIYKADSFNLVRNEFDSFGWQAVEACTALRQQWSFEEPNDLALLALEPDIIRCANILSKEILQKLESSQICDFFWDSVDVTKDNKSYAVDYHPVYYNLEEFAEVEQYWSIALLKIDGIHSVYSFGTENPTCGISDLDLLIVLEDNFTEDIARDIKKIRNEFQSGISGYIKWHEEIIVEREDLEIQSKLWEPAPRFLCGNENLIKDLSIGNDRSEFRKILLFKEGFFQFMKMMEFFFTPSVPLRLLLLRCNSIKYDIKIAEEELGISHPLSHDYLNKVERLRNNWFSIVSDERLLLCRSILIDGLRVLHYLLSKSSFEEVKNEKLELFRGYEPEIDLGIIKVKFIKSGFKLDDPKNVNIVNKEILFPITLFPIVELCLQNLRTNTQFNLKDLSNTLNFALREKIDLFQNCWAKGIEFENRIKKYK